MPIVRRTSQAYLDLVETAFRIAGDNPIAADRWLDIIDKKISTPGADAGTGSETTRPRT